MAYYRVGAYIFSDDFDRFYELLSRRTSVIYTSARDKGVLKTGSASNVGTQRFALHRRFTDEKWLFLDPASQFNPDTEKTVRLTRDIPWGEPLIRDMDAFNRCRAMMRSVQANFAR